MDLHKARGNAVGLERAMNKRWSLKNPRIFHDGTTDSLQVRWCQICGGCVSYTGDVP